MAQTVGTHGVAVFTSPSNGDTLDATVVKGNDNNLRSAYVDHDADGGLHVQSSSLATRSSPGSLGRKWLTTDPSSYRLFFDDGSAWYELSYLSTNGGTVTGNMTVTGTLTASVTGPVTGNASTATALQTARNINGVAFNGTADITVTAAAGTLSGSTLNSGVTASSLTSVGTLSSLAVTGNLTVDTNTLFVDAINNRVGVGTASPTVALDVVGSFKASSQVEASVLVAGGGANDRLGIQGLTAGSGTLLNSTNAAANAYAPLTLDGSQTKFNVAGTTRVTLDASGNLGLGVTPSAWSSVIRAMQLGVYTTVASDTSGRALFGNNVYQDSGSTFRYVTTAGATMYRQNFGEHIFSSAPSGTAGNAITFTQAMTLDASGQLGIGTVTPAHKLDVSGGIGSNGVEIMTSDGSSNYIKTGAALYFQTGSTTKATLDASGNLGLGVTPSAWATNAKVLQFGNVGALWRNDSGGVELGQNAYESATNTYRYLVTFNASRYEQQSGQHKWFTAPSGTAGNAITFTQAMTLDASGNLGVGTTTIGSRLSIGDPGTGLGFTNAASGNFNIGLLAGTGSVDAYVYQRANGPMLFGTNNIERARIKSTGQMRFVPLSADPSGAESGDVYYNSSTNKLKVYNGSSWVDLH